MMSTNKGTVTPGMSESITPHHLSNCAVSTCPSCNLEEVPTTIKSNCQDATWAVLRKRKVFPVPSARVKSHPAGW